MLAIIPAARFVAGRFTADQLPNFESIHMTKPPFSRALLALAAACLFCIACSNNQPAYAELAPEWYSCAARGPDTPDGRIRSCTKLIESSTESAQNRAIAYINRGTLRLDNGDVDGAMADYNQAIAIDPKHANAYNGRGNAYQDKGDVDRAMADYNQAVAIDPKHANAYNGRGNAYQRKGDIDRAIADYDQAIALDPRLVRAYGNRGNAFQRKGDIERAIADYNQAIAIDPRLATAYNARGNAYRSKGELDRALADYNQATTADPKYARAYFSRGRLALDAGTPAKAINDLAQCNQLDPQYAYWALWLEIAVRRSNLPSRLAAASRPIDMTKWPAQIIRLYLGQDTPEAVLTAADSGDAGTRKNQLCEARFYVGELALQQGRKADGVRLFRLAAADCPKTSMSTRGPWLS